MKKLIEKIGEKLFTLAIVAMWLSFMSLTVAAQSMNLEAVIISGSIMIVSAWIVLGKLGRE